MNLTSRKLLPIAAGIALAGTASMSFAQNAMQQSQGDTRAASFTSLDLDRNGSLSKAEVSTDTTLATYFANYDTDGNGELSATEYAHYTGQSAAPERDIADPALDRDPARQDATDSQDGDY